MEGYSQSELELEILESKEYLDNLIAASKANRNVAAEVISEIISYKYASEKTKDSFTNLFQMWDFTCDVNIDMCKRNQELWSLIKDYNQDILDLEQSEKKLKAANTKLKYTIYSLGAALLVTGAFLLL